jgi:hypothetical protein
MTRGLAAAVCLTGVVLTTISAPAAAYVDPNMGGFIFQLLAPLFALLLAAWMFFADRIKRVYAFLVDALSRLSGKRQPPP